MNAVAKRFRICSLVTDWDQYASMKKSLIDAGFGDEDTDFESFDNTQSNRFEPYSLINRLLSETSHPYLIICHQDIRADQGYGRIELQRAITQLDQLDPHWAVLGNAGCTDDFEFILRVRDPNEFSLWNGTLPLRVNSLDENFLLIRTKKSVRVSDSLEGFHLYGTDLCLNARLLGFHCYVIDFVLTHLSAGKFNSDFMRLRQEFLERWNPQFHAVWIVREAEIFLSKWAWLRKLGGKVRVKRMLRSNLLLRRMMTWQLHRKRSFVIRGNPA